MEEAAILVRPRQLSVPTRSVVKEVSGGFRVVVVVYAVLIDESIVSILEYGSNKLIVPFVFF